jgi:hypothetical protein
VQHNLCLIQFLLNLHDAVRLLRILVLYDVVFQLGERQCGVRICKRGSRILREELVDYFGEQLMGNEGWIVMVGDDNASDTFCATVYVESVVCGR